MLSCRSKGNMMAINLEQLRVVVLQSNSWSEALRRLGMRTAGGNYRTIQQYVKRYDLDISHWTHTPQRVYQTFPLSAVLTKNSNYSRKNLKKRLIKEGILKDECGICELQPSWNGQLLSLQLDHINGVHDDNRLENLRLLCPNCHSQTDTFAGKKLKKKPNLCSDCNVQINRRSKRCNSCSTKSRSRTTQIQWPEHDELLRLVNDIGYSATGRMLGVSDNAVRKRLKKR